MGNSDGQLRWANPCPRPSVQLRQAAGHSLGTALAGFVPPPGSAESTLLQLFCHYYSQPSIFDVDFLKLQSSNFQGCEPVNRPTPAADLPGADRPLPGWHLDFSGSQQWPASHQSQPPTTVQRRQTTAQVVDGRASWARIGIPPRAQGFRTTAPTVFDCEGTFCPSRCGLSTTAPRGLIVPAAAPSQ